MANTHNKSLSTFLLFSSIILSFFVKTKQDNPCPYPCYPPPTATGTPIQTPPVSYSPPSQTGLYPPPGTLPTGNLPYFPPPPPPPSPYGNSLYGQPPPDPILPYFPYYYRKPPHQTDDQSSATKASTGKPWMIMIATTNLFVFVFLLFRELVSS
ncbi:hypothetical protein ES319_D01G172400v1 [Gossypium barbadense]|uniref:Hydroxyproline-rich glycoprotein family protein n=1 Tax=Gossypium barbadense TaxID=3634 RepID=A0A5J5SPL8_GOSBA|nr:hypothetical protein ES319_D01G172400v1 [Gossypium barbadense]